MQVPVLVHGIKGIVLAQVLDIEGSIEKLGFDPLDDTKVSVLVLPTAMLLARHARTEAKA